MQDKKNFSLSSQKQKYYKKQIICQVELGLISWLHLSALSQEMNCCNL